MTGTLDVREISDGSRKSKVGFLAGLLREGEAFVLVHDSDPRALLESLDAPEQGRLQAEYLEMGPETWRVKITKLGSEKTEGCCGCCGG